MHNPDPTPPQPRLAVAGRSETFTAGRVFCVGRNYAEHVKEMGGTDEPPLFFMKPASALIPPGDTPYPADTERLDHEIEFVIAIGKAGKPQTNEEARALIFGYAAGIDMTRRDVQFAMRKEGLPWEACKAFDFSAPVSPINPAEAIGHPRSARIWIEVDGAMRQESDIAKMTWSPEALLIALGKTWELQPGDVVFTGTPEGVGPMTRGQTARGGVDGVGELTIRIV
jgi:fumarylpyruvate hydrolase